MVLRQLTIQKSIAAKRTRINSMEKRIGSLKREMVKRVDTAKTDEDMESVEAKISELESEIEEKKIEKQKLLEEIEALEQELADIESEGIGNGSGKSKITGPSDDANVSTEEQRNYFKRPEVRSFYNEIRDSLAQKRSLTGGTLAIPQTVLDRIRNRIGDYSALYNEVDRVSIAGAGRVILDATIPEAIWTEMTGALSEIEDKFEGIELDGYTLGGYIPIPNSTIEDTTISLASYIEDRIAKSIAKSLDKAILKGEGKNSKQPTGIIPSLAEERQVSVAGTIESILSELALVDTDGTTSDEVIAVMSRTTYYRNVLPQTIVKTADGKVVSDNVSAPSAAGLRVVLSGHMEDGQILLGDFKRYILNERATIRIEQSRDVKFTEDQTVFKGVGRYDGRPVNINAFALLKIA